MENQCKPSKLLIVDDSDFVLKLMVMLAERLRQSTMIHFEIITAVDGEEAFSKYVENYKDLKLIFMDI